MPLHTLLQDKQKDIIELFIQKIQNNSKRPILSSEITNLTTYLENIVQALIQTDEKDSPEETIERITDAIASAIAHFSLHDYNVSESARLRAVQDAQDREEMVAIVSHDLKNPLSVIQMNISALFKDIQNKQLDPDHLQNKIKSIDRASKRINDLIVQILDLAELKGGQYNLNCTDCLRINLLMEAREHNLPLADSKSLSISTKEDNPGHLCRCDGNKILQVLNNLISNAIQYSYTGGEIALRCQTTPTGSYFEIQDYGAGIPPHLLPHVFERFWKAPGAGTRASGLGLAIAQGIVQAHRGRILVQSREHHGTTFSFTIPRQLNPN